jgi:hypothetical protein
LSFRAGNTADPKIDGAFSIEYWFIDYRIKRPFPPSPACDPRQSSHALLHSAALVVTAQESAKRNPKSVGGEARSTRLTDGLVNTEPKWLLPGGRGVQRKINKRVKLLASWFTTCALLFAPCVSVYGGFLKPDVNFSNYDVPLYQQIVNRIKAKGAPRLGKGKNTRDRYFIVPFAYQDRWNKPEFSHSFISVIHLLPEGKTTGLRPGFRRGSFKGRDFEAFTISWLPHDFDRNPHLCVFDGFGSRLFASLNKCPISVGRDFTLPETLKLGVNVKNAVGMWGPYEVKKEAFDLGVRRMKLLDGGTIRYRADDRLYRKDRVAINCFHAMAGLDKLYPNGGLFGTGFKMWGINGTKRVLIEYTNRMRYKHLLLDPVNIDKDLYGFVYAPERNSRGLYNPFPNASAYHQ